jgi:hypothetical protein
MCDLPQHGTALDLGACFAEREPIAQRGESHGDERERLTV